MSSHFFLQLFIWKSQRTTPFDDFYSQRREITKLYTRYYCTLLLGIVLMYQFFEVKNLFVLLSCSMWVPQIIHNVRQDINNPFHNAYLFGLSFTRLVLPLYFFLCPKTLIAPLFEYNVISSFYHLFYDVLLFNFILLKSIIG